MRISDWSSDVCSSDLSCWRPATSSSFPKACSDMAALVDELLVILHGLWLRRWLALGVAWGVCLAGWLGVALIPNSYESKARRSEEHTSELQSLMRISYAVFCLKKKQKTYRKC